MRVDLCLNPRQFKPKEVRRMIPALADVLRQHDVKVAYVFGSAIAPGNRPANDLDIAILPENKLTDCLTFYQEVYASLCKLFKADNIDVVLLNQAPLSLQAIVVLEGVAIFDNKETMEFGDRIMSRHADLSQWRQENWEMTRNLVRQGATISINMIDFNKIQRFVFLIRDAVGELRELNLGDRGLDAYLADKNTKALSEHYLRIALEATFELGRHVIVKTGLGVPQEYGDIGKILQEREIVTPELGRELAAMAAMRNLLVHLYWEIEYSLLYRRIVEGLVTFDRAIERIFAYIEQLEEG